MSAYNYAKALFDIALEHRIIEEVNYEFDLLYEVVKNNPEWITVISSPTTNDERKKKLAKIASFNQVFLDFVLILCKDKMMYNFKKVHKEWLKLSDDYRNIAYIKVYSALPLSKEKINKIEDAIRPYFKGKTLEIKVRLQKEVIGGIRIEYQDTTLDNTIKALLDEMKNAGE